MNIARLLSAWPVDQTVIDGSRGAFAMRPVLPQQQTSLGSVGTSA